jgi:hypothetical protein
MARDKATSLSQRTTLKGLFLNPQRKRSHRVCGAGQSRIVGDFECANRGPARLERSREAPKAQTRRLDPPHVACRDRATCELEVHTCRAIRRIDEIRSLSRLKKLHLNNDGEIESLKPIADLTKLESVLFYESTDIVDGDLSPLLRLKSLSRVSFRNRRHYSHRREDFGDLYSAKA